jgi:hypothetical protein
MKVSALIKAPTAMKAPSARRCIAAVLLFTTLGFAQSGDAHAKRVIDDAVAALGGQNFLTMQDRIESGRAYSFYHDRLSGLSVAKIYTRYITAAKGKSGEELGVRERQAFGKNEDAAELFTESGAWQVTWRGTKDLPADQFERYRESTLHNILYLLRQRLDEPGLIFESRGSDVFENLPVNIVDITDSENRVVTVYFHQSTKLPVRQVYTRWNPLTKERDQEETSFARYRDAGGVQWPHEIMRLRNGEKVYQIFSETVVVNQDLADNLFSLPPPGQPIQKMPVKRK